MNALSCIATTMRKIGEPWPGDSNVELVRGHVDIPSPMGSFGACSYMLYEAYPPERRFSPEAPYLLVWLHGQSDMHVFSSNDVAVMARKFNRRIVCMAPKNPGKCNGNEFFWALAFDKVQNRQGLGFVYGDLNYEVLTAFCNAIKQIKDESRADRTILGGYSMGGFGAFQLGGYKPDLFDVIFSIAGHGQGTLLPSNQGYGCPQPDGEVAFHRFLDTHAPKLAEVPFVLAIHAEKDTLSAYHDMELLIEKVQYLGGDAKLVTVPEELANTDNSGKTKSKLGHGYYNFTLIRESSESAFYGPISAALSGERCTYRSEIAAIEADMAAARAAAHMKEMEEKRAKAEEEKMRKDEEKKQNAAKYLRSIAEDKKRDPSPSPLDEKRQAKHQKMAEKKEKEEKKKKEAPKTEEEKRKEMRERRANRAVTVDAEDAPMTDEARRQQMRERRKKLLEEKAQKGDAVNDAPTGDEAKREQMRERRKKLLEQKAQQNEAK